MKAYRVEIEVTSKYVLEVHAEDKEHAIEQTEEMNLDNIECAGDYVELTGVEVTDVELMYPHDDDDVEIEDEPEEEEEPEPEEETKPGGEPNV